MNTTMLKTTLLAALFGVVTAGGLAAQVGDPGTFRDSASTSDVYPGRLAWDADQTTSWGLRAGAQEGWVEQTWTSERVLTGAEVTAQLPAGTRFQIAYLTGDHWVGIPGASVVGPVDGAVTMHFPLDQPPTSRVLVTLAGPQAHQARLSEIRWLTADRGTQWGQIRPRRWTFNQSQYINLKPGRLWDGVTANAWYEPLWSEPWELLTGPPTLGVFPPSWGSPGQEGEIVWELDGSSRVELIKAFFLQDWRNLRVEFWNGKEWTDGQTFGAGWNGSGRGWQRIELARPVTTTRVRITFPGGWERARFIGELELWGESAPLRDSQGMPVGQADASGRYHFIVQRDEARDRVLEVSLAGLTEKPLEVSWNGAVWTAAPDTWVGVETVYRVALDEDSHRQGTQFLALKTPTGTGDLRSVVLKEARPRGLIPLGWPWSDGQEAVPESGPQTPVAATKDRTWSLGQVYHLEKLRVYRRGQEPGQWTVGRPGRWKAVVWTRSGSGWWEATLGGGEASDLRVVSDKALVWGEVELWGTPAQSQDQGVEVWWPLAGERSLLSNQESPSVIGWMGSADQAPRVGGAFPRQADRLFWMPLNQLNLAPGEEGLVTVVDSAVGKPLRSLTVGWSQDQVATLDGGVDLSVTDRASLVVSGSVSAQGGRIVVAGVEVPATAGRFTRTVPLSGGYQNLKVEVWNQNKTKLRQTLDKPVYRTVDSPLVVFDLPAGDLWTPAKEVRITGRVGGGMGLALTMNGTPVPLTENAFTTTVPLTEGAQPLRFVLVDSLGRTTTRTLTILRDTTAPEFVLNSPTAGQYWIQPNVTVRAVGAEDETWWWSLDGAEWEPGEGPSMTWTRWYDDGFYTHTVRARDRSGNVSKPRSAGFVVDTRPPAAFALAANVTGWTNKTTPTVTFSTTDATSGLDYYEAKVDQADWSPITSPWTLAALVDGERQLFVRAFDRAGNSQLATLTLQIDTSAPGVPTGILAIPGTAQVELLWQGVADGEGYQSYRVERLPAWEDGIRTVDTGAYQGRLVDTALKMASVYSYRVWAVDRAGNQGTASDWIAVTVGESVTTVAEKGPTVARFQSVEMVIPQGALDEDIIQVVIHELPVAALVEQPWNPLVGSIYQFQVLRRIDGQDVPTNHADLENPATVALTYDPAQVPVGYDEHDLKAFYYDDLWGRWLPIPNSLINPATHEVVFTTNHFTDFSVQAIQAQEMTAQELRNVHYGPWATKTGPGSVRVSPEEGTVSTDFTEVVLPGKNDFDLVLRRTYDTGTARSDVEDKAKDEANENGETNFLAELARQKHNGRNGDYPWYLGTGWRIDMPWMKWSSDGLWVKGPGGESFSFGQASLTSSTTVEDLKTIVFETHEETDLRVEVTFKRKERYNSFLIWKWEASPSYEYRSAKATSRDGRTADFDDRGRVTKLSSSTGLDSILILYDGDKVASLTDTRGRVVSFIYGSGSGRPTIKEVHISAGGESWPGIIYTQNDDKLATAQDLGGRLWSYDYSAQTIESSTYLLNPPEGYTPKRHYRRTTVQGLSSVAGPGIGRTTVLYVRPEYEYEDVSKEGERYHTNVRFEKLMGKETTLWAGETRLRSSEYTIKQVASSEPEQFYTESSIIDDGRSVTTLTFTPSVMRRMSLSQAPEALRKGLGLSVGERENTNEVLANQTKSVVHIKATDQGIETTSQEWDTTTRRVKKVATTRGTTQSQVTTYTYDTWGNPLTVITTTTASGRTTGIADTYHYHPTAVGGSPAVQVGLGRFRNDLVVYHNRTITGQRPTSQSNPALETVAVSETQAWKYGPLGQVTETWKLKDGTTWAEPTRYTYFDDGQIATFTSPTGQVTQWSYADAPLTGEASPWYSVTTTNRAVDLGDEVKDLSGTTQYRRLSGLATRNTDERGFVTQTAYDNLGRPTQLTQPWKLTGETAVTMVEYSDVAPLTSTVTNPRGAQSVYWFDTNGRLTRVDRKDRAEAPTETITTTLTYDPWDQVMTLAGPVSNLDQGRTLDNVVTRFTYDDQGRVTTQHQPDTIAAQSFTYDDNLMSVVVRDPTGHEFTQTLGWNGETLSQNEVVTDPLRSQSQTIQSSTYFDGEGRSIAQVDPRGSLTKQNYGPLGPVAIQTLAPRPVNGVSVTPELAYHYDDNGALIRTEQQLDELGQANQPKTRVQIQIRNGLGWVLQTRVPVTVNGQAQVLISKNGYNEKGQVTSQAQGYQGDDLAKRTSRRTYDPQGRVLTETDAEDHTISSSYDPQGNRLSLTDPRHGIYTGRFDLKLSYDAFDRLIVAELPSDQTSGPRPIVALDYDGRGNLMAREEGLGSSHSYTTEQTTRLTYNLRNLPLTQTLTDGTTGYTTRWEYDPNGRPIVETSPTGKKTYTQWDEKGRVVQVGNEALGWNRRAYDPNGNVVIEEDGRGNRTTYQYTVDNQPDKVTDAKNQVATVSYDRWGQKLATTDAEKNVRTYRYDEAGRLVSETTPWNTTNTTVWDGRNNPALVIDGRGTQLVRTYTPANRIETELAYLAGSTTPSTTTWTWDEAGDLKAVNNGAVNTQYNQDTAGRYQPNPYSLTTRTTKTVGGQSLTMSYARDHRQRMTKVTNPDQSQTIYTYNNLDQVTQIPGWTGQLAYDAGGRLKGYELTNGITKTLTWDDQDRLDKLGWSHGGDELKAYQFGYDKAGNVVVRNDSTYAYDQLNQLTTAQERGLFQKRPEETTVSHRAVDEDYRGTTPLTLEVEATEEVTLDYAARSVGVDLGTGDYLVNKIELHPRNAAHRVRPQDLSVWSALTDGDYTKITNWKLTQGTDGSLTIVFETAFEARYVKINTIWDDRTMPNRKVDRGTFKNQAKDLVKVWVLKRTRDEAFEYDQAGNRSEKTVDGTSEEYRYYKNADGGHLSLLATDGSWYYRYDGNGNLVTKAKAATIDLTTRDFVLNTTQEYWNYAWDAYNRLTAVTKNGAPETSYVYDAENLRIQRVGKDGTTVYGHGRNGALTYTKNLDTGKARTYSYLNNQVVGWIDTMVDGTKTKLYATTDQLGSVTAITDVGGATVWASEYQPFGETAGTEGTYDFDGMYAGHQPDNEVGLIYMWNRWQDPTTGRFLSEDPARDGNNWYAYVGNNPINSLDPTGLKEAPGAYNPEGDTPEERKAAQEENTRKAKERKDKSGSGDSATITRTRRTANIDSMGRVRWDTITEKVPATPANLVPESPAQPGVAAGEESDANIANIVETGLTAIHTRVLQPGIKAANDLADRGVPFASFVGFMYSAFDALLPENYADAQEDVALAATLNGALIVKKVSKAGKAFQELAASKGETTVLAGSNIRHINGVIGEAHGYADAIKSGQIGIQAPGKVTATGPDFITFDSSTGRIIVWDSKYSSTGRFPSTAKGFGTQSWLDQTKTAIDALSDPALRAQAQKAFQNNMIDWQIYKWPK